MAFKCIEREWCPLNNSYRHGYVLDSVADVASLPASCPGSVAVTADGSGAVFMVNASGEWAQKSGAGGGSGGGGGTFIINVTDDWEESEVLDDTDTQYIEYRRGGVADKTYAEIESAFNSGMTVVACQIESWSDDGGDTCIKTIYNLSRHQTNSKMDDNNYFDFKSSYADNEGAGCTSITIRKTGDVQYADHWGAYAGGAEES